MVVLSIDDEGFHFFRRSSGQGKQEGSGDKVGDRFHFVMSYVDGEIFPSRNLPSACRTTKLRNPTTECTEYTEWALKCCVGALSSLYVYISNLMISV
jgi:hypothetical protein